MRDSEHSSRQREIQRRSAHGTITTPPLTDWPDAGVYQLWLRVPHQLRLRIGRLGVFSFPAGRYVYTGRAARGLRARIARHLGRRRCRFWHIDYLLSARGVRIERVTLAAADPAEECRVNRAAGRRGAAVVPGFGASDCRTGCPAHLWWISLRDGRGACVRVRARSHDVQHQPRRGAGA